MTKAREIMTPGVDSLSADSTIAEAAEQLARNDVGAMPVCNPDGRLEGMVTDRDIVVKVIAAGLDPNSTKVVDITDQVEVVTIGADDSVDEAIATMKKHKVRRLPVIDGTELVGMVSQADLATNLPSDKVGSLIEVISAAP